MQRVALIPRRVLMTVDAVGGVWRYAVDLASGLRASGAEIIFAGFGPAPSPEKAREAERLGRLVWLGAPLDWMCASRRELSSIPGRIADLARREGADLLHLNLPSQAAGLECGIPVVVASHSCVVTWFAAVRGELVPEAWQWQFDLNRAGFDRADAIVVPSRSHQAMLQRAYGPLPSLQVVWNGSRMANPAHPKGEFIFAAGRWWDEGKNARILDGAAGMLPWPVIMAGANTGPNGQHVPIVHADHRDELTHGTSRVTAKLAAREAAE